jgi:hypothetical protein
MTKTSLLAAIAIAATTAMTGCAVDQAPCSDVDCIETETEGYAPDADLKITDGSEKRSADFAGDRNLTRDPVRIAALQDWTLRLADGEADACDERLVRSVADSQNTVVIDGCEDSFLMKLVDSGEAEAVANVEGDFTATHDGRPLDVTENNGRPEAVALAPWTVEEMRWLSLAVDISEHAPLTITQERLFTEADASRDLRTQRITKEQLEDIEPQFHPRNL